MSHEIKSGRLEPEAYQKNFCDLHPPLDLRSAKIESVRCHYCYDAPCVQACPTEINIPGFIRKISEGNVKGAATQILKSNIMGGTCARVCPVEILCEKACVRHCAEDKPVEIGKLQRFATDFLFASKSQPFKREKETGKTIAIVGAGPAGLSCAHKLSTLGHQTLVFESKDKPGGLNEYGLAAYKVVDNFVQREIDFITQIGGIEIQYGKTLGQNLSLEELQKNHDAVFLGVGLGAVNNLGLEEPEGVLDAVTYICELRQSKNLAELAVGKHVVVIGGGNTAIDIAVQIKRLGAEHVHLVYRRGTEQMGATEYEQELAKKNGIVLLNWAKPVGIDGDAQGVSSITFEKTQLGASNKLEGTGEKFSLPADQIFKAIGQKLDLVTLGESIKTLEIVNGRIAVDENQKTSIEGVYAGGDCAGRGEDLTVQAVQDGKIAALAIHKKLMEDSNHG